MLFVGLSLAAISAGVWGVLEKMASAEAQDEVIAAESSLSMYKRIAESARMSRGFSESVNLDHHRTASAYLRALQKAKADALADQDPRWYAYFREMRRRSIIAKFEPFLKDLNLDAKTLIALKDLLTDRGLCERLARDRMVNIGFPPDSRESESEVARAKESVEKKIEGLVGASTAALIRQWAGAAYYFGGIVKEDVAMLGDAGFEVSESRQVRMALIRYNVTRASSKTGSSPIIVGGVRAFRSGRVWRCGSFRRCGIPVRRT
jgi:hypothetical protein